MFSFEVPTFHFLTIFSQYTNFIMGQNMKVSTYFVTL